MEVFVMLPIFQLWIQQLYLKIISCPKCETFIKKTKAFDTR